MTPPQPTPRGEPHGRPALMLALATVGFAINFWAWALLSPLAPRFKDLLALSGSQQALLVAVPVLVGSLGRIPVGALTDRFGGRVMFPLVSLATWWLIRSPWGRAFVALRENPMRALSLGVDTRRYTLMAFALGAGLGGISGALYAPLVQFVDPTPFALGLSLNLLLMVVVGGSGFFFAPFLGAMVAVLLRSVTVEEEPRRAA